MSDIDGLRNPPSLQEQCRTYVILHLEHIPPAQLALLPPHFVQNLVSKLPLLDILSLENSAFARTMDFQQFWRSVCTGNLPRKSAELFYLESRKWLEALGIQSNSREFCLAFLSNCALFPHYMPLGNALSLLLVRTSDNRAISSLLQLCSGDAVISDHDEHSSIQLKKEELLSHVGRDIGILLPERYLPFILQWENPTILAEVLFVVANFRPHLICVPEGALNEKHLSSLLKWGGVGEFLSCVEAFHLSLGDPTAVDEVPVGKGALRLASRLAETVLSCSSSLRFLHVVGSQANLDQFFSGFHVSSSQNAMLQSIEVTSEEADGREDEATRKSALVATGINSPFARQTTVQYTWNMSIYRHKGHEVLRILSIV